jgi:hypothetical protein
MWHQRRLEARLKLLVRNMHSENLYDSKILFFFLGAPPVFLLKIKQQRVDISGSNAHTGNLIELISAVVMHTPEI